LSSILKQKAANFILKHLCQYSITLSLLCVGRAAHADAIAAALNFFGPFLLQGKKERKN